MLRISNIYRKIWVSCKGRGGGAGLETCDTAGSEACATVGCARYGIVVRPFGRFDAGVHLLRPEDDGLERVRRELRASGVKGEQESLRTGTHSRGYLPHVKREGSFYFVTFRLADSLPKEVLMEMLRREAERLRELSVGDEGKVEIEEIERDFRREFERYLDRGAGACFLRREVVADLVANALQHFNGDRYVLDEWVVMPNHVYVVVQPMENYLLGEILKSWKQFTSRRAKEILQLGEGPFWQPESYDHWIRNDEENVRIRRYVRNNPVKARLYERAEDWRWSSAGWKGE